MTHRLFLSIATAGVLAGQAFASTIAPATPSRPLSALTHFLNTGTWIKSVSVGYGYLANKQDQRLELATSPSPGLINGYVGDSNWGSLYISTMIGKSYAFRQDSALVLGMEGAILANNDVNGTVHPLVNVANDFDRLNYHYSLRSYSLMAKAELGQVLKTKLSGYLSVGLGGAVNHLSDYSETVPGGSTARPMSQPFGDKSRGAFALSLGTGVRYQVNNWAQWGIGYRYIDTGKGELGLSPTQPSPQHFQTKRLTHHLIAFSLTC